MKISSDKNSSDYEELCHSTIPWNITVTENIDFWGDGVFNFICGIIGVLGNLITILIFRYEMFFEVGGAQAHCFSPWIIMLSKDVAQTSRLECRRFQTGQFETPCLTCFELARLD